MIYRNAIVLVTLAVSSNAFWWGGGEREMEPQPTIKQVPVGYFRAFTYQPLPFNPQSNQYFSYPGGKMLQQNSLYSYQKSIPGQPGFQPSVYGMPSHQPPNTPNGPPPIAPTNTAPVQSTQQQPSSQLPSAQPSVSPTSSTSTQSHPTSNEIQPPTPVPAQFSSNPHVINNSPIRQVPYIPDPVNLQYITNVAPVPLQHIQFVPCMCPVAVSVTSPDVIANKRSDELPIPADYRDTSIGEQSLSEER